MATWKLANSKNIPGLLDKTDKFLGMDTELAGCMVSIPTSMDIKTAINNVGGVISAGIRSLEIWWDSEKQELQIVLIASTHDLDKFKQACYNMYPNIDFEDIEDLEPEWFEKSKEDYQIFDVGYKHGHFSTVFDQAKAHLIITQIANTIQLSKFAWIQIVFKSHSFVKELQSHLINLQNHNRTISGQYYPASTWLFSDRVDMKDHPEKFGDFASNFKHLDKHTTLKTQNSHVLTSVRGIVESNIKLNIDLSNSLEKTIFSLSNYKNKSLKIGNVWDSIDSYFTNDVSLEIKKNESIQLSFGVVDTSVLGYDVITPSNYFINKDFPFPLLAIVYSPNIIFPEPLELYGFELLEYNITTVDNNLIFSSMCVNPFEINSDQNFDDFFTSFTNSSHNLEVIP